MTIGHHAVTIILYLCSYDRAIRRRIRKLAVEALGSYKPYLVYLEFNEEAWIVRTNGTEIKLSWNNIKAINEDDNVIEFIISKGGLAFIPKRIFETAAQKDEWLNFARGRTGIKAGSMYVWQKNKREQK